MSLENTTRVIYNEFTGTTCNVCGQDPVHEKVTEYEANVTKHGGFVSNPIMNTFSQQKHIGLSYGLEDMKNDCITICSAVTRQFKSVTEVERKEESGKQLKELILDDKDDKYDWDGRNSL